MYYILLSSYPLYCRSRSSPPTCPVYAANCLTCLTLSITTGELPWPPFGELTIQSAVFSLNSSLKVCSNDLSSGRQVFGLTSLSRTETETDYFLGTRSPTIPIIIKVPFCPFESFLSHDARNREGRPCLCLSRFWKSGGLAKLGVSPRSCSVSRCDSGAVVQNRHFTMLAPPFLSLET